MIEDLNPSMKIIVIGNGQVGKSTLTIKFVKNIFTTEYKQTLGVDFLNIKKYIKRIDQEIDFYIWDTAGQDHFNAITRRYYRGADACLIVFAINDRESFNQVKSWHQKMTQECGKIPTALVMSKIDLKDDIKVTYEEAENLSKELKLKLFKISSKEGIQVEECFEYLAVKHYNSNGCVSSGADNIEDVQKELKIIKNNESKNDNDDDIEELPSEHKKNTKKKDKNIQKKTKNEENIVGFKLGSKGNEEKQKDKKLNNCC
jgi:Ras-related protein Rab-23